MKNGKLILTVLILLLLGIALTNCSSSRKSAGELRSLMLQDNLQLGRNRAFYSKHNVQARKTAYKRYARNGRHR
ncbi:MAG: hypothetical protein WCE64_16780 [Bacteroidales bacterium]